MSEIILQAEQVSVTLGRRVVVEQATLALRRGVLTVLLGPNGAGKTTLVRALAGLLPAQGRILLDGRTLTDFSARERAQRIAYLPQGNVFHWPLPVENIVALGRYPHGDPFTALTPDDRAAIAHALAATTTDALAARPVTTLSGGEKARVALARALSTQAPVLLADEPIVSLDPRHQLVVMELLRKAAHDGGAVLAVMHDLSLASRFAGEVVIMQNGRIVAQGTPQQTLNPQGIAETFGVEAAMLTLEGETIPLARRPL